MLRHVRWIGLADRVGIGVICLGFFLDIPKPSIWQTIVLFFVFISVAIDVYDELTRAFNASIGERLFNDAD